MITVLVIDDDATIRTLYQFSLEEEGFNVLTAENGINALEVAKNNKIDFMIVDENMPEMDGWQFIQELKKYKLKTEGKFDIPFIVLTGTNFISKHKTFYFEKEKGFLKYFEKMTPVEDIINFIKGHIK